MARRRCRLPVLVLAPLAVERVFPVHARAAGRDPDRGPVCDEPAFHHGSGRHAFIRSCRIFWFGCVWRSVIPEGPEPADGSRAACSARCLRCVGAIVFGWFCVRLSGVYLAMLTLAFAQIVWSIVFQWDAVTGGSNGILNLWPSTWLSVDGGVLLRDAWCSSCLGVSGSCGEMLFSPLGYAMRASRDSTLRAEAIGIDVKRVQWVGFHHSVIVLRPRGIPVCVLQGVDLAGSDQRRVARSTASSWCCSGGLQTLDRPDCRRGSVHLASRYGRASDRLLGGPARPRRSWCW